MNLNQAIADVAQIRAQMMRTESMQGFRSVAVGISVVYLMLGTLIDFLGNTDRNPEISITIWLSIAGFSAVTALTEMGIRTVRQKTSSGGFWKMHRSLFIAVIPSLVVGAILTFWFWNHFQEASVKVNGPVEQNFGLSDIPFPALWMLCYGLGLANARHCLPCYSGWASAYLLTFGALGTLDVLPSFMVNWNLQMVFGIGGGHLLLCWALFRNRERSCG